MSRTRILIADDNPVFRTVLKSMLTNWGYETIEASDGAQAWSLLASDDAPRLAILDWMMPGMDGVDVCRRVRASGRPGCQYILILTAKAQGDDLLAAMDAGADDYVTKPFKSLELRVRLRTGLRILELEDQLHRPAPVIPITVAAQHPNWSGYSRPPAPLMSRDREGAVER